MKYAHVVMVHRGDNDDIIAVFADIDKAEEFVFSQIDLEKYKPDCIWLESWRVTR